MKSEKYEPPSERQYRRMKQLGLGPYPGMTGHRATQMINEAVVKLGLGRGDRLSPIDSPTPFDAALAEALRLNRALVRDLRKSMCP